MLESQIFHKPNVLEYDVIRNNSNLIHVYPPWQIEIKTNNLPYNQDLIFKNEQLNNSLSMQEEIAKLTKAV